MKNYLNAILLGTFILGVAAMLPAADAPASFSGSWKAEFDGAIGHLKYTYDLKQDGTNITGKATRVADDGTNVTTLAEGKVTGGTVSFVEALSIQGQDLRIDYKGALSATNKDELKLTRSVGEFATNEITATRGK